MWTPSRETCEFCNRTFVSGGVAKHIGSCTAKYHADLKQAEELERLRRENFEEKTKLAQVQQQKEKAEKEAFEAIAKNKALLEEMEWLRKQAVKPTTVVNIDNSVDNTKTVVNNTTVNKIVNVYTTFEDSKKGLIQNLAKMLPQRCITAKEVRVFINSIKKMPKTKEMATIIDQLQYPGHLTKLDGPSLDDTMFKSVQLLDKEIVKALLAPRMIPQEKEKLDRMIAQDGGIFMLEPPKPGYSVEEC